MYSDRIATSVLDEADMEWLMKIPDEMPQKTQRQHAPLTLPGVGGRQHQVACIALNADEDAIDCGTVADQVNVLRAFRDIEVVILVCVFERIAPGLVGPRAAFLKRQE